MPSVSRLGCVPAIPRRHRVLLTSALAANHYGSIEISRINQIMVEQGKQLAYVSIDELQDPVEL